MLILINIDNIIISNLSPVFGFFIVSGIFIDSIFLYFGLIITSVSGIVNSYLLLLNFLQLIVLLFSSLIIIFSTSYPSSGVIVNTTLSSYTTACASFTSIINSFVKYYDLAETEETIRLKLRDVLKGLNIKKYIKGVVLPEKLQLDRKGDKIFNLKSEF